MNWKTFTTLFLDRDGVINRKLPGLYINRWEDFEFLPGTLDALAALSSIFRHILIVTNQQGIGKGLMTLAELQDVHERMLAAIREAGGRVDGLYYNTSLESDNHPGRKPRTGMAYEAQRDFPDIRFHQSIMVGDSPSDMEFAARLGMARVLIAGPTDPAAPADLVVGSLWEFYLKIRANW